MEIKIVQNENEVYQKQSLLGEGAFGKAYLVKHKPTNQYMVIKQMNIEHMSTKEKEETIKEAQILKNLNHPNIVNFKEVYITKNNKLKIVMQYAECGDLAKAIAQRKAKKQYFEETHILDWFTQICLAIKHVHDRKILHRDIKGHNIFIAKNNSLKLGDFGIARVLNMTHDKARTVVGTPYYLSPEIIENKPYSFKSDIWSIGAVLYQVCALQPPFTANSLQMLALKIVKGQYPPIPSQYSQDLRNLIKEMLTLDPNKRPNINDILKKPIITGRIKNFLSQTKRIAEFSHTILHNQKVQIFANKLVQLQKQKSKPSASNEKNLQYERQKLKEEQARMEALLLKKKEQQKKKQEKRRQDEIRRRQQEIKRKQEQKKKRIIYEQQKRQQMQRQYDLVRQRRIDEEKQSIRQMEIAILRRQKEQQEERRRKEAENQRKINKMMEQDKKQQDFNELARKQYFENLQIRKRAEERARREQQGYYDQPVREQPVQPPKANYHFSEQNQRPQTKQQSKQSSVERKQNNSDFYNRQERRKQPQPTQEELINAFCNPNYNKKAAQAQNSKWAKEHEKRPSTAEDIKQEKPKKQSQSNKKAEVLRQQMRKDRQNYAKQKEAQKQSHQKLPEEEPAEVGKWGKKKSSEKKQPRVQSNQKDSPRFRQLDQARESSQKTQTTDADEKQVKQFNALIEDSENLFLQVKNPLEFDKYIEELKQIVQGVQKKVDLLPQIQLQEEIKFREDDIFQLSLTALPQKQQEEIDTEGTDLDYFSNYSKLQTLRMQLQEALGLQNFINIYRYIEKQVSQKGLDGFNIEQAIKQVGGDIDRKIVSKNGTLLLTLVTLQDKMSYT